jgi:ATP-binding cassette subfamily F protein 3
MPLIELVDVEKDWGLDPIFSNVCLKIEEGEKVGIVGPNGSGKTSLIRILAGLDEDFHGRVLRKPKLSLALVPQRFEPPEGLSCVEILTAEADSIAREMASLADSLASSSAPSRADLPGGDRCAEILEEYGEFVERYEALGGDGAEDMARRLLAKAGLDGQADSPARSLSGGEKNLLALTLALTSSPELLVLDEPGNHLDFAGLAWLEDFVRGERRAILMVSHNRALLDRSVDRIVELEGGRAREYAGGYSAYRLRKLSEAAGQGRDWQADRVRIERLEALVARFAQIAAARPDPAWGRRLRAKRSRLEREKEAAAAMPDSMARRMSVSFAETAVKSDYAIIVRGYGKAYGDRSLFDDAGFDLLVGERAALIGANGSGKTSFIRDLVARGESGAESRWDSSEAIRVGPSQKLGYCAQEQEVFARGRTVGEEFGALGASSDQTFRLLKGYRFARPILDSRVETLSGGERNRLQIARAVYLGANLLVLDEPTNHLDIESREALEEGLEGFEGTLLVVSHDRWFLEKTVDRLILVEGGKFVPYEGSFAEYWRDLGPRRMPRAATGPRAAAGRGIEGRKEAVAAKSRAAARSGAGMRAAEIEERIASFERRKAELEGESARLAEGRDYAAAGRAAAKALELSRTLDRLYAEWEAILSDCAP